MPEPFVCEDARRPARRPAAPQRARESVLAGHVRDRVELAGKRRRRRILPERRAAHDGAGDGERAPRPEHRTPDLVGDRRAIDEERQRRRRRVREPRRVENVLEHRRGDREPARHGDAEPLQSREVRGFAARSVDGVGERQRNDPAFGEWMVAHRDPHAALGLIPRWNISALNPQ